MRFMICLDSEKGNQTIYEIVNGKPIKITAFPTTTVTPSEPKSSSSSSSKNIKKAK